MGKSIESSMHKRLRISTQREFALVLAITLGAAIACAEQADQQVQRARIKDVATIEGIRDN
jgi:hypothetical protein